MKTKISKFHMIVQQYTLKSMLKRVVEWSYNVYNNPDELLGHFAGYRAVSYTKKVCIVQTWMIDLVYDLIVYNKYGTKEMSSQQALIMIGYYNNFKNDNSASNEYRNNNTDFLLFVYGFSGEQFRFQTSNFFEEFAREKYILEKISKTSKTDVDVQSDFMIETQMSSDLYSSIIFLIINYFETIKPYASGNDLENWCSTTSIPFCDVERVKNKYTISLDGIRNSPLKRQVFYTNPFIIIDDELLAVNPYILLCLFTNSNYWIIRNRYMNMNSRNFTNAFGIYFENYVEEILNNTVDKTCSLKVPTVKGEKRADWKIQLGKYDILVEQKCSLPFLSIKQNETDVKSTKKYITKYWGEAVEQLERTEVAYSLKQPIKIVLVYDQYFKSESLENMFDIRKDLTNDGHYWLVTIRDFEILMMLYKTDRNTFDEIMEEKIKAETTFSKDGRDLSLFYEKHKITDNEYLKSFGIYNEFTKITDYLLSEIKR